MTSDSTPPYQFFRLSTPAPFTTHVEINRPQKYNSFPEPMFYELRSVFQTLSSDPHTRVILLSGAGPKAFTTGLDVAAAAAGPIMQTFADPSRRANELRRHIAGLQSCITAIADCSKPVIACIHGYAYGLAIDIATACDIRVCAADARFSIKEVDIGLAADVGTLSRVSKVVGGTTSWVKEVALTARVFGAEEARENRFVSRVLGSKEECVEEGVRIARVIGEKSPVAVLGTKNILEHAWGRTVEESLGYTAVWNSAMLQSSDVERAMGSGLQKRKPTFEKL